MKDDVDEMHKILPKQIVYCDDQHDKKRLQKLIDECELFYNNYISLLDRLSEMKSKLNSTISIFNIGKQQQHATSFQVGDSKTFGGSSIHGSQNSQSPSIQMQNQNQKETIAGNGSSASSVLSPLNRKQTKKRYDNDNNVNKDNVQTESQRESNKEKQNTEKNSNISREKSSPRKKNNLSQQQTLNSQKISTKSSGEDGGELNKTFTSQIINLRGKEKINLQIRYLKDIYELIVTLVKSNLSKLEIFQAKPPVLDEFDDFVKFRKIIEMDRHIISLIDTEKHKCPILAKDIILPSYIKDVKLQQELISYTPQFLKVLGDLIQTYQECLTPDLEAYVTSYNEFAKLTLNTKSIQLLRNLFYNLLCFIVKKEIIYIKIPFFIEKIERSFNQITGDKQFFIGLSEEQKEIEEDLEQINIIITTFQDKEEKFNQITYTLHRLQLIYRRIRDYHTIFFTSNAVLPNYNDFHPFLRKLYDHIFKGGDEDPLIQESATLISQLEVGNHKLENDFHNVSEKPKFIPVLEKINDITENLIYMLKTINQSRESINFFSLLQVLHTIGEYFVIKKEPVILLRDAKNSIVYIQPLIRQVITDYQNSLQPNSQKGLTPSSKQQQIIGQQQSPQNSQSKYMNTSMIASSNKSHSIQQIDDIKQNSDLLLQSNAHLEQEEEEESQLVLQKTSPLILQIQNNLLHNEYFGLAKSKKRKRFSEQQISDNGEDQGGGGGGDSEEVDSELEKDKESEKEKELEWFEYIEQMEESRVITEEAEVSQIQTCVQFMYNRRQSAIIILIPQSPFSSFNYEVADIDTNRVLHQGIISNNISLSIPLQINSPYGLFSLRLFKKYLEDNSIQNHTNPSTINCQKNTIPNNNNNNINNNETLTKSLYIKTSTQNNGNSLESNYAQQNSIEASYYQFTRFEQDQALLVKSMLINKYNLNEYPITFKPLEKYIILIQRQINIPVQYYISTSNQNEKQNIKTQKIQYVQLISDSNQNVLLQQANQQLNKTSNSLIKIEKQSQSIDNEQDEEQLEERGYKNHDIPNLTTDMLLIKNANFQESELIFEIPDQSDKGQDQQPYFPIVYVYKKGNNPDTQPIVISNKTHIDPSTISDLQNKHNTTNDQKQINRLFMWRVMSLLEDEVKILNTLTY